MATAFLSSDWYRVAELRLRRQSHIRTVRHVYRGEAWHVLQDPQNGKVHRLPDAAYAFFARLDGTRTVQDIWLRLCDLFPARPPSQTEILQLLAQLHDGDLIIGDKMPNLAEIDRRARAEERRTLLSYVKNPLSLRIPLFDPETLLTRTGWIGRAVFSVWGGLIWVLLLLTALTQAFLHFDTAQLPKLEQVSTASNIAYLAVAYVLMKALHELGHGWAVKRWGGEVREFGVMMLLFFPVPYVDASQATFFPSKWQRMIVSAAGIMVELAVASLAFLVWLAADPGTLRTLAYNLMMIGGVSTLLFNGNPLLRFDGYFVFADFFESPNLGQRSNQYFWFLVRRTLLRDQEARPPVIAPREGLFLFAYAVISFVYRMMVLFFISVFLAMTMPLIGTVMVAWSLFTAVVMPLAKGIRYLGTDPSIDLIRGPVLMKVGGALCVVLAVLFILPLPHVTVADAVLQPGTGDLVRVQGRGFVEHVLVSDGQTVTPGTAVMDLSDPLVSLQRQQAEAERDDATARLGALPLSDQNGRQLWQDQVGYTEAKLADLTKREAGLIVRAEAAGQVYVPNQTELPGRLVQQGEVVAVILSPGPTRWQVAIPATQAPYVDAANRSIELVPRPSRDLRLQAQILSRAPEVTTTLPSFGLTTKGGGMLLVDPSAQTPVSLEPVVNYLLEVAQTDQAPFPQGSRARVRFVHDPSPIGPRLWRALERTFLRQFGG